MQDSIEKALLRKEKYLSENPEYRKEENLFHRHLVGKYVGDLVYGANDGIITTFAVVAGATGAGLSGSVIIVLGLANLLADGISMGASNFLGSKTEKDYARAQRKKENWEIEHLRELEVEEVKEIFAKKGFRGKDLERSVALITSNKEIWIDTMMKDELGIIEEEKDDPQKHGLATFTGFLIAGFMPLIPYLLPGISGSFLFSTVIGALALLTVGMLRSFITTVGFLRGGLEMLAIGSAAALVAYFVGRFVEQFV